jgi:hypothetical protein
MQHLFAFSQAAFFDTLEATINVNHRRANCLIECKLKRQRDFHAFDGNNATEIA